MSLGSWEGKDDPSFLAGEQLKNIWPLCNLNNEPYSQVTKNPIVIRVYLPILFDCAHCKIGRVFLSPMLGSPSLCGCGSSLARSPFCNIHKPVKSYVKDLPGVLHTHERSDRRVAHCCSEEAGHRHQPAEIASREAENEDLVPTSSMSSHNKPISRRLQTLMLSAGWFLGSSQTAKAAGDCKFCIFSCHKYLDMRRFCPYCITRSSAGGPMRAWQETLRDFFSPRHELYNSIRCIIILPEDPLSSTSSMREDSMTFQWPCDLHALSWN